MKMSDQYVDSVLAEAQRLLWGGSETENIEAHNLISKLIRDRMSEKNLNQGQIVRFTTAIYKPVNFCYNYYKRDLERIKPNDNKA